MGAPHFQGGACGSPPTWETTRRAFSQVSQNGGRWETFPMEPPSPQGARPRPWETRPRGTLLNIQCQSRAQIITTIQRLTNWVLYKRSQDNTITSQKIALQLVAGFFKISFRVVVVDSTIIQRRNVKCSGCRSRGSYSLRKIILWS